MEDALPFPIKFVFLLLVLPVALVYLVSVAGVVFLFMRRVLGRLATLVHTARRPQPPRP